MLSVHHIAIATPDPVRLAAFYERVLGFAREKTHVIERSEQVRSIWLTLGGQARLMLERQDHPAPPAVTAFGQKRGGIHLIAFSVAAHEKAEWLAKLVAHQVPVEQQSDYTVYFYDVDGNRIALSHYPV